MNRQIPANPTVSGGAPRIEILGVLVVLIYLVISLGGCYWMADPEYFMRAGINSVVFKSGNKLQGSHVIELPGAGNHIELQGLLYSMESTCGEIDTFILRVRATRSAKADKFILKSDKISILIKDSLVLFRSIDTLEQYEDDKNTVFDLLFGGDTCRNVESIQAPLDSINPKVSIFMGVAIEINGQESFIDTVYAYK